MYWISLVCSTFFMQKNGIGFDPTPTFIIEPIFLKTGRRAGGAAMFNMAKNNTRYGILVFVFCTKIRDNGDNKIPGMENFPESETE